MTNNNKAIHEVLRSLENLVSEIKSNPRYLFYIRSHDESLRKAETAIQNARRCLGRP